MNTILQPLTNIVAPSPRKGWWSVLNEEESIAPLVTFRVLFGLVMAFGAIRFVAKGWIEKLYGEPTFFFKFYGFHWVPEPSVAGAYALYGLIALTAIFISLGFLYRFSVAAFFLTFTWSELIDATNYLNHYYLVCLLSILLFFVPANGTRSLDVLIWPRLRRLSVPKWCRWSLLLQLSIVYFFAGLAKLNPDWLFRAMPLAIWLPEHGNLPIIGALLTERWVAFAFSWFGAFYDITIVAWLLWKPSRPLAYMAVLAFHLMTWMLFNIGLFPLIMMTSTLLFFPAATHAKWWRFELSEHLKSSKYQDSGHVHHHLHSDNDFGRVREPQKVAVSSSSAKNSLRPIDRYALLLFFAVQLLLPLRIWAYPGNSFWTEEGYRFGWRVMLVEKSGQATFTIQDPASSRTAEVDNREFLTQFQEKQMAIQPDFMVQYARHLAQVYAERYDISNPMVTADVFVALNGRPSQRLIDPQVDLATASDNLGPKPWILPLQP